MEGYIKLYRKMVEWQWYTDGNTMRLFLHLLLKANHKEWFWRWYKVNRWQLITGRDVLSKELGLTQQQIRTSINKLKSTSDITIKATNRFSLITLTNYNEYQQDSQPSNQQITNKQPTDNQQITTNKNDKNKKNDKNIINSIDATEVATKKINSFDSINKEKIIEKYNITELELNEEIELFIRYWTEPNQKWKQRWQFQKTFEPNRRLATWLGNNNKWKKTTQSTKPTWIARFEWFTW